MRPSCVMSQNCYAPSCFWPCQSNIFFIIVTLGSVLDPPVAFSCFLYQNGEFFADFPANVHCFRSSLVTEKQTYFICKDILSKQEKEVDGHCRRRRARCHAHGNHSSSGSHLSLGPPHKAEHKGNPYKSTKVTTFV